MIPRRVPFLALDPMNNRSRRWLLLPFLLVGVPLYFVPVVAYDAVTRSLGCCGGGFCCDRPSAAALNSHRVRAAATWYLADNPGRCPSTRDLIDTRYLGSELAVEGVEIRCDNGVVSVTLNLAAFVERETLRDEACGRLKFAMRVWLLPLDALAWVLRTLRSPLA
jgi:hypothetical protein